MSDATWLVVGLGNPGSSYDGTRHNIGHLVVDELARRAGGKFKAHRSRCDVVEARVSGERSVLAKPRSYMNESGGPVAALRDYFKADPGHLIVVHDELDIPYGALRLKSGGGDNGHNGLKSIRSALGTGEFLRVRVGIGRPPGRQAPADFVLKPFSVTERKDLEWHVVRAADSIEALVSEGLDRAQMTYNADPE
jgi:PTH1 family peptidyl-tRNA hydrolase